MSFLQLAARLNIDGKNPVSVSGTGTATKYLPAVTGNTTGVSATTGQPGFLYIPGSGEMNGRRMLVRASGDFQCPASDTTSPAVTIGLYGATGNFVPSAVSNLTYNTIFSYQEPGSAPGVVSVPWMFTANLICTTKSGILQGDYSLQIDAGSIQSGSITSLSGINMYAVNPLALVVGFTFSQSFAGNVANMYEFDLSS